AAIFGEYLQAGLETCRLLQRTGSDRDRAAFRRVPEEARAALAAETTTGEARRRPPGEVTLLVEDEGRPGYVRVRANMAVPPATHTAVAQGHVREFLPIKVKLDGTTQTSAANLPAHALPVS